MEPSSLEQETVAKKDDKKVQDAHEAIRPTYMTNSPKQASKMNYQEISSVYTSFGSGTVSLWQAVWHQNFKYENTSVKIAAGDCRVLMHPQARSPSDGFLSVYNINNEELKEM